MNKIFLLALLLAVVSCKKDKIIQEEVVQEEEEVVQVEIFDTVSMGNYFPAYPGSFWKYLDSNGDTTRIETSPTYVLFQYQQNGQQYYGTRYNGQIVDKYRLSTGQSVYGITKWEIILPDNLYAGNVFTRKVIQPTTECSGTILAVDTSITINSIQFDSVIVVKEASGPIGNGTYFPSENKYYAKHIGIIKIEVLNSADSIINTLNVTDYFVND